MTTQPTTPFTGSAAYSDFYTQLNKTLGLDGSGTIVGLSNTKTSTPAYMIPVPPTPVAPNAPVAPAVAAPVAPVVPAAPASPTAPAAPASGGAFPPAALQPGSTDAASVTQLQNYLVSQGLMTPEQVATGPGVYGPQTTAAVAALQKKLGVDNSSGVGFFGPKTIAALGGAPAASSSSGPAAPGSTPMPGSTPTETTPPADNAAARAQIAKDLGISDSEAAAFAKPSKTSEQVYNDAYATAGLGDLKQKILDLTAKVATARQQLTDAVGTVNENPFLTEQSRVGRGKRLLDQAGQTINNDIAALTDLQKLYDTGLTEINAVVSRNNADFSQGADLAQKKLNYLQTKAEQNMSDFTAGRTSPTLTGSADTGYYRYDPTTKKFVQVIPASSSAAFNKLPTSYQEWVLAGKPGDYGTFAKSRASSSSAGTFSPTESEKSLVSRFIQSADGKAAGATPEDMAKAQTDSSFFYFILQKAIDAGYSTQI